MRIKLHRKHPGSVSGSSQFLSVKQNITCLVGVYCLSEHAHKLIQSFSMELCFSCSVDKNNHIQHVSAQNDKLLHVVWILIQYSDECLSSHTDFCLFLCRELCPVSFFSFYLVHELEQNCEICYSIKATWYFGGFPSALEELVLVLFVTSSWRGGFFWYKLSLLSGPHRPSSSCKLAWKIPNPSPLCFPNLRRPKWGSWHGGVGPHRPHLQTLSKSLHRLCRGTVCNVRFGWVSWAADHCASVYHLS